MPIMQPYYGSAVAGNPSALQSLNNDNNKAFAYGSNITARYTHMRVFARLKLGSSGVSSSGIVQFYLLTSPDQTYWTDNITYANITGASNLGNMVNARLIRTLRANANSQVVIFEDDLFWAAGYLPKYWAITCHNKTGAQFSTTAGDFDASVYPITFEFT